MIRLAMAALGAVVMVASSAAAPAVVPVAQRVEVVPVVDAPGMVLVRSGPEELLVPAELVEAARGNLTGLCTGYCPKVVVIDAKKMPFIARNIRTAVAAGKPKVLTRIDPSRRAANSRAACGRFLKKFAGGSCDEYPFASSVEGGAGAQTQEVPREEQNCQGGTILGAYNRQKIEPGEKYGVLIGNFALTPKDAWQGGPVDTPEVCG